MTSSPSSRANRASGPHDGFARHLADAPGLTVIWLRVGPWLSAVRMVHEHLALPRPCCASPLLMTWRASYPADNGTSQSKGYKAPRRYPAALICIHVFGPMAGLQPLLCLEGRR